jgi:hypothetical protein
MKKNRPSEKYEVVRAGKELVLESGWDGPGWNTVRPLSLELFMGEKPEHRPRTEAKAAYDNRKIYVAFRVEDRYVRAVAEKNQDSVCCDSCAEFFFTPNSDIDTGYFNLEMNCGGTLLLYNQTSRSQIGRTVVAEADCRCIEIYHQLPKRIDPEIADPVTWMVAYAIPFEMLEKYSRVTRPGPGVSWRANFYKCADHTSHPHWLTWSKVDNPRPDFHLPEFFGTLKYL